METSKSSIKNQFQRQILGDLSPETIGNIGLQETPSAVTDTSTDDYFFTPKQFHDHSSHKKEGELDNSEDLNKSSKEIASLLRKERRQTITPNKLHFIQELNELDSMSSVTNSQRQSSKTKIRRDTISPGSILSFETLTDFDATLKQQDSSRGRKKSSSGQSKDHKNRRGTISPGTFTDFVKMESADTISQQTKRDSRSTQERRSTKKSKSKSRRATLDPDDVEAMFNEMQDGTTPILESPALYESDQEKKDTKEGRESRSNKNNRPRRATLDPDDVQAMFNEMQSDEQAGPKLGTSRKEKKLSSDVTQGSSQKRRKQNEPSRRKIPKPVVDATAIMDFLKNDDIPTSKKEKSLKTENEKEKVLNSESPTELKKLLGIREDAHSSATKPNKSGTVKRRRRETISPSGFAELDTIDEENEMNRIGKKKKSGRRGTLSPSSFNFFIHESDQAPHSPEISGRNVAAEAKMNTRPSQELTQRKDIGSSEVAICEPEYHSMSISQESDDKILSPQVEKQGKGEKKLYKSCLSASKIGRRGSKANATPSKSVAFGSPRAAKFNATSPVISMTPICDRQAKIQFPMEQQTESSDEEVDAETSFNTSLLDEVDDFELDKDEDVEERQSYVISSARRRSMGKLTTTPPKASAFEQAKSSGRRRTTNAFSPQPKSLEESSSPVVNHPSSAGFFDDAADTVMGSINEAKTNDVEEEDMEITEKYSDLSKVQLLSDEQEQIDRPLSKLYKTELTNPSSQSSSDPSSQEMEEETEALGTLGQLIVEDYNQKLLSMQKKSSQPSQSLSATTAVQALTAQSLGTTRSQRLLQNDDGNQEFVKNLNAKFQAISSNDSEVPAEITIYPKSLPEFYEKIGFQYSFDGLTLLKDEPKMPASGDSSEPCIDALAFYNIWVPYIECFEWAVNELKSYDTMCTVELAKLEEDFTKQPYPEAFVLSGNSELMKDLKRAFKSEHLFSVGGWYDWRLKLQNAIHSELVTNNEVIRKDVQRYHDKHPPEESAEISQLQTKLTSLEELYESETELQKYYDAIEEQHEIESEFLAQTRTLAAEIQQLNVQTIELMQQEAALKKQLESTGTSISMEELQSLVSSASMEQMKHKLLRQFSRWQVVTVHEDTLQLKLQHPGCSETQLVLQQEKTISEHHWKEDSAKGTIISQRLAGLARHLFNSIPAIGKRANLQSLEQQYGRYHMLLNEVARLVKSYLVVFEPTTKCLVVWFVSKTSLVKFPLKFQLTGLYPYAGGLTATLEMPLKYRQEPDYGELNQPLLDELIRCLDQEYAGRDRLTQACEKIQRCYC